LAFTQDGTRFLRRAQAYEAGFERDNPAFFGRRATIPYSQRILDMT
jgi:hypothetical protein